ncbi:MAG: hypothetical protein JXR76_07980 [Deltaproteobacteria bacterium]|nr:hypothetical protein [Deltaproteobacteria bacterium]
MEILNREKQMSTDDTFSGAKTAYIDYYTYVKTAMEDKDIGKTRALSLMTKADETRGKTVGMNIREEAGGKVFETEEAAKTIVEMAKGIGGIDEILEQGPQKVVTLTRFGKCPVYEAAREVGMDDGTIEEMCRAGALCFLNSVASQLNPALSYRLKAFRSGEAGGCVEEIAMNP